MRHASFFAFLSFFLSLSSCSSERYAWSQRATLIVETRDGIFSSSSVHRVEWRRNWPQISGLETDLWTMTLRGDAPFVMLPNDAVIVATLGGGTREGFGRMLVQPFESPPLNRSLPPHEDAIRSAANASDVTSNISAPTVTPPIIMGFVSADAPESAFWVSPSNRQTQDLEILSVEVVVKKSNQHSSSTDITQALPWLSTMDTSSRVVITYDSDTTGRIPPAFFKGH